MVKTENMNPSPPRLSTKDYMIRSKALDLLRRSSTPEHEIIFACSNDGDGDSESRWDSRDPISYQHSPEVPMIERKCPSRQQPPAWTASQHQWTDALLPAVSCISSACRVGVSGIVKQTADGYNAIKGEFDGRRLDTKPRPMANLQNRHAVYRSDDSRQHSKQVRDYRGRREIPPISGQHTAERHDVKQCAQYDDSFYCGCEPLGYLFVPRDRRACPYDDVSEMTDDGLGSGKFCFGFCPIRWYT